MLLIVGPKVYRKEMLTAILYTRSACPRSEDHRSDLSSVCHCSPSSETIPAPRRRPLPISNQQCQYVVPSLEFRGPWSRSPGHRSSRECPTLIRKHPFTCSSELTNSIVHFGCVQGYNGEDEECARCGICFFELPRW